MNNTVVFFGSGPVAAESLRLLKVHQTIEAVVTKPTTQKEMLAVSGNTPVLTVENRAELDKLIDEKKFISKLGVLIDFGIIVSQHVIDLFPFGIINSHFSLLPEWRGADPITFSILSGQEKTGVSLMMIDQGMDTGKLLTQKSLPVQEGTTTPQLTQQLVALSNQLLQEYIPKYLNDEVKLRHQPHPERTTYSRKLTKEDGVLDFTKPAEVLEREIRAFLEWPKSRTRIGGKDVVILRADVDRNTQGKIGTIFKTVNKKIGIHTSDGTLIIQELKPAGKNAMTAEAFLAGYGNLISS